MITSLADMLFGCWHRNYSFPITSKSGKSQSEAASFTGTYVVCLDCGKEFPYDWQRMKVISPRARAAAAAQASAEEVQAEAA
jgi:RNA polymerase-binding transcription factor DksA